MMAAMQPQRIRDIVIVGGGTAGWMAAAALSKLLTPNERIVLVESDEIGTIGVGEATIPNIRHFNSALELDDDEFVRETQGTFKLGIQFCDWGRVGDRYIHGFGAVGPDTGLVPFHHYWLKMRAQGKAPGLQAFQINTADPDACKFQRADPALAGSPLGEIAHAYHFDAGLYARYLRRYAEARGVTRLEGRIVEVRQREPDGFIESVVLAGGREVAGQLFLDCSGLRGLLIEQTLRAGFENWSHWLPCDAAVAVPCESAGPLQPLTRSTARSAGWQWRIPLQHRTGNGLVYCSALMSADEAAATLLANLDGRALAEPRPIRFKAGRRRQTWVKNVVAIGLAGGFLEPLESTSIHLIQQAINRLIGAFPWAGFDAADIDEFNRQCRIEIERIRDFIIFHYTANERPEPLWRSVRHMALPPALVHKMALFAANGRIVREDLELFGEPNWLQVMVGQNLMPRGWHPLVETRDEAEVAALMQHSAQVVANCLKRMPTQAEFIARHCRAAPVALSAPSRMPA
jgi:tryptophan 7-halogenase